MTDNRGRRKNEEGRRKKEEWTRERWKEDPRGRWEEDLSSNLPLENFIFFVVFRKKNDDFYIFLVSDLKSHFFPNRYFYRNPTQKDNRVHWLTSNYQFLTWNVVFNDFSHFTLFFRFFESLFRERWEEDPWGRWEKDEKGERKIGEKQFCLPLIFLCLPPENERLVWVSLPFFTNSVPQNRLSPPFKPYLYPLHHEHQFWKLKQKYVFRKISVF